MKIIDLLNRIAKGEEVPTEIKINMGNGRVAPFTLKDEEYINHYTGDTLIESLKEFSLNDEILEEVEDKEYEDIDYADNLEQGEYIDYASDYEVKFDIVKNRRLINALIRNQKYILEQLKNEK